MKTLKYRSAFVGIFAATLSVFLFTACEKDTDNYGVQNENRLEKFKRLTFSSGSTSSSTSSTSSGTFTGSGGNISYTPPSGGGNTFAPTSGGGNGFTDPMSNSNSFSVGSALTSGGGTVTLDGKSYELDFGLCVDSDLFGIAEGPSGENLELEAFIGVSGDFDISMVGDDESDDFGFDLLFYAFSYNGGSQIGDFDSFEGNGEIGKAAFVIAVKFAPGEDEDGTLYFATEGSINFSGSNVVASSLKMAKVNEDQMGNSLGKLVRASAFLECGSLTFEDEGDDEI
jgi:hypothetical protein